MSLGSLKPPFFFFSGDLFGDGDNTFFWAEFLPSRKKNILDSPRAGVENSLFTGEGYKFLECRDSRVVVFFAKSASFLAKQARKTFSRPLPIYLSMLFPPPSLRVWGIEKIHTSGKERGKGGKRRRELSPPLNEEICRLCGQCPCFREQYRTCVQPRHI